MAKYPMDKTFDMLKTYNELIKASYGPMQIAVVDNEASECSFKVTYEGGLVRVMTAKEFEEFIFEKLMALKRSIEFKLVKFKQDLKAINSVIRSKERANKKALAKREQA